jgi:ubiquinol-cytochrome c reductase cytochrome c subunit
MKSILMAAGAIAAMLQPSSANAGDATRGEKVFMAVGCNHCHGTQAQGMNTGPRLAPNPMPLEALVNFVRTSDKGQMPTFSPRMISDADLADIHAYLASIKRPPDAKDLPLLNNP